MQNSTPKRLSVTLTLTNANYQEDIRLLQKRFGQNEIIINAHYTSLMDLPASTCHTSALRTSYDTIEKHLRSLQALGEDVNTKMLVSLIMSKLPKDVITHLTDHKVDDQEWPVQLLRDKLHRYITNRENAERQCGTPKDESKHPIVNMWPTSQISEHKTTTEALFSVPKPPKDVKVRRRDVCIYCSSIGRPVPGQFLNLCKEKMSKKNHLPTSINGETDRKTAEGPCQRARRQRLL